MGGYLHSDTHALQLLISWIGYNMAKNLQSKLPNTDTLRIYDINEQAIKRFVEETNASSGGGAAVEVASSIKETSQSSVSLIANPFFC